MDLGLERIELRARRRAAIGRRRIGAQRRPHRVARQPRAPDQLLDRDAPDEVLAPQLGPPLHVQHPFLPASTTMIEPGSTACRTPPPNARGGQISTGGRGSVFNRRRQSSSIAAFRRLWAPRAVSAQYEIAARAPSGRSQAGSSARRWRVIAVRSVRNAEPRIMRPPQPVHRALDSRERRRAAHHAGRDHGRVRGHRDAAAKSDWPRPATPRVRSSAAPARSPASCLEIRTNGWACTIEPNGLYSGRHSHVWSHDWPHGGTSAAHDRMGLQTCSVAPVRALLTDRDARRFRRRSGSGRG
jgi:hypothetical protein